MIKQLLSLLFLFQVTSFSQGSFTVNKDFNKLYLKAYYQNNITQDDIELVRKELNKMAGSTDEADYFFADKKDFADLSNELELFSKNELQKDSVYKSFYTVYLKFVNTFNKFYSHHLYHSSKKKIVFLTTSVSCECTIEMCQKQLAELIKFVDQNKDQYELIVEDTWNNSFFKDKYEVGFIPTTLILNKINNAITKYVREELETEKITLGEENE